MRVNKRKLYIFAILFALLLFHCLNNYLVLAKSRYCLKSDSSSNFAQTRIILQSLREVRLDFKSIVYKTCGTIFGGRWSRPPLFFITSSPFFLFSTDKNSLIVMSNAVYFAILLFASYGIGNTLYNFKVGVLSAFLVSMFPAVFALSRVFMVDFALMSMVALTFYLFALNRFASTKFSLLIGIIIGLGALLKQSYFIFLFPITSYFFLSKDNLKNKKIIKNFILAITVGLFVAAFYYARHFYNGYLHYFVFQNRNVSPFFYLQSLLGRQLLIPFFLLFLFSSAFSFKEKKFFLPAMVLALLIIMLILPLKQNRFILPVFPYIAVIISGFIWSFANIRKLLIVSLVLFSLLQYFTISFPQIIALKADTSYTDDAGLFSITDEGDWRSPSEEIIKIISEGIEEMGAKRMARMLVISQNSSIISEIEYLLMNKKLPVESVRIPDDVKVVFEDHYLEKEKYVSSAQINRSDFVIVDKITQDEWMYGEWIHTFYLLEALRRNIYKFEFVKTVRFPNKLACDIYTNKITMHYWWGDY
ncbi:MAG: glycosyltransferase family 39 protein [Candidatus Omnitrophota bacterium]